MRNRFPARWLLYVSFELTNVPGAVFLPRAPVVYQRADANWAPTHCPVSVGLVDGMAAWPSSACRSVTRCCCAPARASLIAVSGVRFHPNAIKFPHSPLPMVDSSVPGRAILKTVRASLRLARNSSKLLTVSQLLAMESNIINTLATVRGQIQAEQSGTLSIGCSERTASHPRFTDDCKVILNMSDWDGTSDEEKEDTDAVGSNPPNGARAARRSRTEVAGGEGSNGARRTSRASPTSRCRH